MRWVTRRGRRRSPGSGVEASEQGRAPHWSADICSIGTIAALATPSAAQVRRGVARDTHDTRLRAKADASWGGEIIINIPLYTHTACRPLCVAAGRLSRSPGLSQPLPNGVMALACLGAASPPRSDLLGERAVCCLLLSVVRVATRVARVATALRRRALAVPPQHALAVLAQPGEVVLEVELVCRSAGIDAAAAAAAASAGGSQASPHRPGRHGLLSAPLPLDGDDRILVAHGLVRVIGDARERAEANRAQHAARCGQETRDKPERVLAVQAVEYQEHAEQLRQRERREQHGHGRVRAAAGRARVALRRRTRARELETFEWREGEARPPRGWFGEPPRESSREKKRGRAPGGWERAAADRCATLRGSRVVAVLSMPSLCERAQVGAGRQ